MTLLVTYASTHGSTREMAQHLSFQLQSVGFDVRLRPVEEVTSLDGYTAVILGSPIHCGLWTPSMHVFVSRHRADLIRQPLYAWITCVRVLEPGGYTHAHRFYIPSDFRAIPSLRSIEIFAGKVTPTELSWQEKHDLHHRYDGFYNVSYAQGDYRDWSLFDHWIQGIINDLRTLTPPLS